MKTKIYNPYFNKKRTWKQKFQLPFKWIVLQILNLFFNDNTTTKK